MTRVPSLDELDRLTAVPDRRVVFRGVDWAFYEDWSTPSPRGATSTSITTGRTWRSWATVRSTKVRGIIRPVRQGRSRQATGIRYRGMGLQTTWKRPEIARVSRPTDVIYFQPEKLAAAARALVVE